MFANKLFSNIVAKKLTANKVNMWYEQQQVDAVISLEMTPADNLLQLQHSRSQNVRPTDWIQTRSVYVPSSPLHCCWRGGNHDARCLQHCLDKSHSHTLPVCLSTTVSHTHSRSTNTGLTILLLTSHLPCCKALKLEMWPWMRYGKKYVCTETRRGNLSYVSKNINVSLKKILFRDNHHNWKSVHHRTSVEYRIFFCTVWINLCYACSYINQGKES